MSLHIKPIDSNFADVQKFRDLNVEAFRADVRLTADDQIALAEKGKLELAALYDGDEFVGYFSLTINPFVVYIEYLAISKNVRSKGYGSQALAMIKALYPERQIVLDIERADELDAPDIDRRKSRKAFYLKNGYFETGYSLEAGGISFEVLCDSTSLDTEHFREILSEPSFEEEGDAELRPLEPKGQE